MRAITRVPEPPVAPITNGAKLATPTLATVKAGEQYPSAAAIFSISMKSNRAIVFPAWGAEWIDRVASCVRESQLPRYPIFLITDAATDISALPAGIEVIRRD